MAQEQREGSAGQPGKPSAEGAGQVRVLAPVGGDPDHNRQLRDPAYQRSKRGPNGSPSTKAEGVL